MAASKKHGVKSRKALLSPHIETYTPFLEDVESQMDGTIPQGNVTHNADDNDYLNSRTSDETDRTHNLSGIKEEHDEEEDSADQDESKPASSTNPNDFQLDRDPSKQKAYAGDYYKARVSDWRKSPWRERTAFDETALRAKEKPNPSGAASFFTDPNTRDDDPDNDQDRDDFLQNTQTQMDGGRSNINDYYKSRSPDRMTLRSERTGFQETPVPATEKTNAAETNEFFTKPDASDDPDHDKERDDFLQKTQTQMDGGLSDVDDYYNTRSPDWMTPRKEPTGFDETAPLHAKEKTNAAKTAEPVTNPNNRNDLDHDKERDDFLQETQTQMGGGLPDVNDNSKSTSPAWMTPWREWTEFDDTLPRRAKEKSNAPEWAESSTKPSTRDDLDHDRERDDYLQETQKQMDGGLPDTDDYYNSRPPDWTTPREEPTGIKGTALQSLQKPNTRDDFDPGIQRDDFLPETQTQTGRGLPDANDNSNSTSPDWIALWKDRLGFGGKAPQAEEKTNVAEPVESFTKPNSRDYNSRSPDWIAPRWQQTGLDEAARLAQDKTNAAKTAESSKKFKTRDHPDHDRKRDDFHQKTQMQMDGGSRPPDWMTPREMDGGLPHADDYYNSRIPDWREEPTGLNERVLQPHETPDTRDYPDHYRERDDYLQKTQTQMDGSLPHADEYYNSRMPDWREEPTGLNERVLQPHETPNTRDYLDHDRERDHNLHETQTQMDGGLPHADFMMPREEPTGFNERALKSHEKPHFRDYPDHDRERDDYLQDTQTQMDGGLPLADDYYNSRPKDWMMSREEPTGFNERALKSHEKPHFRDYPDRDRERDDYLQDTQTQMDGGLPLADDYYNPGPKDWMTPKEEPTGFNERTLRSQEKPNTGDDPDYNGERDDILQDAEKQQESAKPTEAKDHAYMTKKLCCRPSSLALLAMLASLLIIAIAVPLALSRRGGSASDASDNYPIASPTADTPAPSTEPSTQSPVLTVAATPSPSGRTPEPTVDATAAPTSHPSEAATIAPTLRPTAATPEPSIALTPEQIGCNFLSLTALSDCRDTIGYSVGDAHGIVSTIPSEIGLLTQMEYLSFRSERLTGSIPSSMSNLTRLALLDISSNGLTGSIPASLCSQMALIYIDCGEIECNCCLSGNAPYQACLSQTQTNAPIPAPTSTTAPEQIACNFLSLTNLNECRTTLEFASYNGTYSTTGSTIPSEIGLLTQLTHLDFFHNHLTGSIPSSLSRLTQLSYLNFSYNELTGSIPSSLSNLTELVDLDFSFNRLTGSIPSSVSNLIHLTDLAFTLNKLTGTIPSSLSNLSQLARLAFTGNLLTGSIPIFLESLSQLVYFSVYNNYLTGSIPSSLCSHVTAPVIDCGEIDCICCVDYFLEACT